MDVDELDDKVKGEIEALRRELLSEIHALNHRMDSSREEVNRAASDIERRLSTMNEFREQLREQAGEFFTRREHYEFDSKVDARFNANSQKIDDRFNSNSQKVEELRRQQDKDQGMRIIVMGLLSAAVSMAIAIVASLIIHR